MTYCYHQRLEVGRIKLAPLTIMQRIGLLQIAILLIYQLSASPTPKSNALTVGDPFILSRRADPTAMQCGREFDQL